MIEKVWDMIKYNSEGKITWKQNMDKADLISIKSYPNPCSGPLTLDVQGLTGKADLRVYDQHGRNIYVQHDITEGITSIDLSALPPATYMYVVYQGSKAISSGQWVKM